MKSLYWLGNQGGNEFSATGLRITTPSGGGGMLSVDDKLATILDILAVLEKSTANPDEVLQVVVTHTSKMLGGSAFFSVLGPGEQTFEVRACCDSDSARAAALLESLHTAPQDTRKGLTARALKSGEPVLVRGATAAELRLLLRPERAAAVDRIGARSVLIVPAKVGEITVGTLVLFSTDTMEEFSARDGSYVQEVANLGGQAVLNGRLFRAFVRVTMHQHELVVRLRETEERFKVVFDTAPYGIVITDPVTRKFLAANEAFLQMLGVSLDEVTRLRVDDIHPSDVLPAVLNKFESIVAGETNVAEDIPVQTKRGNVFYADITAHMAPYKGSNALVAVFRDSTPKKEAEAALMENAKRLSFLTRHLIELQECERRRLAAELHDELGQSLTSLSGLLDMCLTAPESRVADFLAQARAMVTELMAEVRNMALELRPAMLDHFGLLPALSSCAERLKKLCGLKVDIQQVDVDGKRFPPQVETAAFRLVQEALTNVARHAGVNSAVVRVWRKASGLFVQVNDKGRGFDIEKVRQSKTSLGLVCMEERVKMARGRLWLESEPGVGTYVTAFFPLEALDGEENVHTHC